MPRSTTSDPVPAGIDDISGRQHLDEPVEECELTASAVLVTDAAEASHEVSADDAFVALHVTVDNASTTHI